MIIIPAERAVDWRRPPWATLLIILINAIVYFGLQSGDTKLIRSAVAAYHKAGLLNIEAPLYINYLDRKAIEAGHPGKSDSTVVINLMKKKKYALVSQIILLDPRFYKMLQANGNIIWPKKKFEQWQDLREPIVKRWIDQLSSIRFGIIPRDFHLSSLISYQFLHGGIGHLLGNMVFLFLLGFTVERALGSVRYTMSYLTCGMLSGVFYTLVEKGSLIPMIGASGAISGLMGMYVVLFGLQKIRFFYYLGFFFNYFMAPAILLLPIWIGKELIAYFTGGDKTVAYMAHAGGLLAGAALMAGLRKNILQVKETFYDKTEDEKDEVFRKMYASALNAVSRMEFNVAHRRFEILAKKYPERPGMLQHLYHLEKLKPESDQFHASALKLIKEALKRNYFDLLIETYRDYVKRSGENCQMNAAMYNQIMFACLRHQEMVLAERVFDRLKQQDAKGMIEEACQVLIHEFKKRQDNRKIAQYQRILDTLVY
jgi:membrane associated rhomboid family serine protease